VTGAVHGGAGGRAIAWRTLLRHTVHAMHAGASRRPSRNPPPPARPPGRTVHRSAAAVRPAAGAVLAVLQGMAALALRAPLAAALATLVLLQVWALWRAPAAWFPETVTVRLAAGGAATLGASGLAAPRADAAHIELSRDAAGAWRLRNLGATRPATIQRGGADQRLAGVTLAGARSFQAGGAVFALDQAGPAALAFRHAGHAWRYDGATLYRDGRVQPACADATAMARVAAAWNRIVPGLATVSTPLAIGGHVHCGNRVGVPALPPGAATVARGSGQLRFAAGPFDDGGTALLVHAAGGELDARRLDVALAGVTALSVAGARYAVTGLSGDTLTLAPARHVTLYGEARMPETAPPAVTWQWRQRTAWWQADTWPNRLALAALAAALLMASAWLAAAGLARAQRMRPSAGTVLHVGMARPKRPRWQAAAHIAATVAVLLAGIAAMAAQRSGAPPAAAFSLLLAAAGAALWRMPGGRVTAAVGAALVLAMAGLLMQLELGLAAPDLAALRHYHKTAALLAVGSALAALWRLWHAGGAAHHLRQRGAEWALAALTAAALAALAAQALWGDETGVFDMQPVELAKLALAALSAHGLALHLGGQTDSGWRWLRLAAPALLFCALLGMALVYVDDYSPLILLAVWAGCIALAYAAAARRPWLAAGLAMAALALAAAVGTLRGGGPDLLARLPQSFYADRFQVWLAPGEHPHTGQQWLQGARAIAAGGWFGADHLSGLRMAGLPDSAAAAIPAVQDDFAPSFFMYRHGLTGALLLWGVQAAMLAALLRQAATCHRRACVAQGFRPAWRERLRCFLLCGGAAFLFGHFLLSWGTNLAIFPVMGQPMSFLSAGGSHLLFFLCPLLAVSMDAAQPS
jgi:cell division protein FtsW